MANSLGEAQALCTVIMRRELSSMSEREARSGGKKGAKKQPERTNNRDKLKL